MNAQTTIKLPGAELPYGALSDWKLWLLLLGLALMIYLARRKI